MSGAILALLGATPAAEPPLEDGALYSWGFSNTGERKLGDNVQTPRSSPVQVGVVATWLQIAVGEYTVLATRSDGTLWAWGNNTNGTAGKGTTGTVYSLPSQVGALTNWDTISGQYRFVVAIKKDNSLWTWGNSDAGQGGRGSTVQTSSPNQVGALYDWMQASAGLTGCMAVRLDGTLWSWGANTLGVLMLGATGSVSSPTQVGRDTNWFSVSVGGEHSLAIRTDGTLWAAGRNDYGELGTGNLTSRSSPVQVGLLTDWVLAVAAYNFSLAIKADGTLWAWGRNGLGQLAQGNTTNRSSPVQIGTGTDWRWITANLGTEFTSSSAIHAIKADGTLWAWGSGLSGQGGTGNTTTYSSPVQVGAQTDWTMASRGGGLLSAAGGQTAFGLRNADGGPPPLPDPASAGYDLFVAGNNNNFALAYPAAYNITAPLYIAAGQRWRSVISLKDNNSYGIRGDGKAYACGIANGGYRGATITSIAANPNLLVTTGATGASMVVPGALISGGRLWCWGSNAFGQVGDSTTTPRSSPVQIGALTTWASVSSNGISTYAIKDDGTLWSWGGNGNGQLGNGNTTPRSSPVQVGALTNWLQVFIGSDTTDNTVMAVKTDGTLWGWGSNVNGRIGDGTTTSRSSPVQAGAATTWREATLGYAIRTTGAVYQLATTHVLLSGTWVDVSSSGQHHALVNAAGEFYTWGLNDRGQLGLGDLTDRASPTLVSSIPRLGKAISCSEGTTVFMVKSSV